MRANVQLECGGAISGNGRNAAENLAQETDGKSAVDSDGWFAGPARALLPTKAGAALHYLTGFDERICQRYAAGHTNPPGYFIRALLRSEQGWQWLATIMDGSDARWWREVQELRCLAARYAAIVEITKRE